MRARFVSPGYMTMAIGAGHAVWGLAAYRSALREIGRAGYIDSVGDGLFRRDHSHDHRAAAFWFMAIAPVTVLAGYLSEAAIRAQDRRAVAAAGTAITLMSAAGVAAMPRSGFPGGVLLGAWMVQRAARIGRPVGGP